MKRAFDITLETLEVVMRKHDKEESDVDIVISIFDDLDHDLIVQEALRAKDLVTQTVYAQAEIEKQLKALGVI